MIALRRTTYDQESVRVCASRIISQPDRLSASPVFNTALAATILSQFTVSRASISDAMSL
jgi:hypothetical protein